jgi:hypothetical protein
MAEQPRHPETRDVWPGTLLLFGGGLLLFLVVAAVLLHLIFNTRPSWPRPGAASAGNEASPALPIFPKLDLASIRAEEDSELARLAWVDRGAGVARIPIDEAMKLVATRGLPDWSRQAAATSGECAVLSGDVPRTPQAGQCRDAAPVGAKP